MTTFRTTSVGSFPKPPELKALRAKRANGRGPAADLRAAEREATRSWMELQNALGVDEPVHGEMERDDMIVYFAERISGFVMSELTESFAEDGMPYVYRRPVCVDSLSPNAEPGFTVPAWKEAQALSVKPVKGMLTDPLTLAAWSSNTHYVRRDADGVLREDRAAFVRALVPFVRAEAIALQDAGCEILQLDCPGISTWPDCFDLLLDVTRAVLDGLSTKTVCHICFADYDRLYPRLLELPFDAFLLELSQEADPRARGVIHPVSAFDAFREHAFTKELGLGVIYVHEAVIPSVAEIHAIVRAAEAAGIPRERIVLTPDCGLKTRSVETATEMLRRLAEARTM